MVTKVRSCYTMLYSRHAQLRYAPRTSEIMQLAQALVLWKYMCVLSSKPHLTPLVEIPVYTCVLAAQLNNTILLFLPLGRVENALSV